MTDRDNQFEVLRQQGFRLYHQQDQLTIKQRRLADVTYLYQSVSSQISQTAEEATDLCKGSRWSRTIREEETTCQQLKASIRQSLAAYEKTLKAEAAQVQALIAKNVQAKANLFQS